SAPPANGTPREAPLMRPRWLVVLLLLVPWSRAGANPLRNYPVLRRTNGKIAGYVVDYTHNHGADNRIWSDALGERRDLYVYLPPGLAPCQPSPLMLWLPGFGQDEVSFVQYVVPALDRAIVCGQLPPLIIAAPDGTLRGRACLLNVG